MVLRRLNPPDAAEEDIPLHHLPPHWKCSCHLLNLVATKNCSALEGCLKSTSMQTFAKLYGIWNKQNRSSSVAPQTIREALGSLLVTPGDTQWNSLYDATARVNQLFAKHETRSAF